MGRFPQNSNIKGSQKWIQKLVNENSEHLNSKIKENLNLPDSEIIQWLSPLANEAYKEYSDQEFISRLEIKQKVALDKFWPKKGPVWDALGKSNHGNLFLVEAKSHISELSSSLRAKNPNSKRLILKSLNQTRTYLGSNGKVDWSKGFYQYTNRLAHLYFLRVKNQLPAYLVNVYFINDLEVKGPKSISEWKGALNLLRSYLGIGRHKLQSYILDVFIDINDLEGLDTAVNVSSYFGKKK